MNTKTITGIVVSLALSSSLAWSQEKAVSVVRLTSADENVLPLPKLTPTVPWLENLNGKPGCLPVPGWEQHYLGATAALPHLEERRS